MSLPLFMLTWIIAAVTADDLEDDDDDSDGGDDEDDDDYDDIDDDNDDDNDDDEDDECLFVRPGLLLQPLPLSLFNSRFGPEPYKQALYTKPWHRL